MPVADPPVAHDPTAGLRRISNSEATDFATCKRLYLNAYVKELAPRVLKGPLAIGTVGHLGLEAYFKALKNGELHEAAVAASDLALLVEMRRTPQDYDIEAIMKAKRGLDLYYNHYGDPRKYWDIVEVETKYEMPIPGRQFVYALRVDVIVRDRNTNDLILVDHKFVYDFWTERKFKLRAQFPKYVAALRYNNVNITKVMINEIRHREMKSTDPKDYLRLTSQDITDSKMRLVLRDHIELSKQILEFRALSPEQQERQATRTLADPVCKYCSFAKLCETELDGGFTDVMVQQNYKKNTYAAGYQHPPVEMQLEEMGI
jgi:CRISPR/Cas system-associated exonuclease Cas4 (RecB family)